MRLSSKAFNAFLKHIGQQVAWSQSFACPCLSPTSGQPDTRCPHCFGKGHLWPKTVPTVCGVAGQQSQQQWAQAGMWADGDLVVTVPSDSAMWVVGPFDRVTMLNGQERFSTSLTRNSPAERLQFKASSLERVFWFTPARVLVDGDLPTLDDNGRPVWADGAVRPPPGTQYSITGSRKPEYYCLMEMPSSRNEHSGEPLPRRVVLRKFDLLGRINSGP